MSFIDDLTEYILYNTENPEKVIFWARILALVMGAFAIIGIITIICLVF
jgi:hypothetical protein